MCTTLLHLRAEALAASGRVDLAWADEAAALARSDDIARALNVEAWRLRDDLARAAAPDSGPGPGKAVRCAGAGSL